MGGTRGSARRNGGGAEGHLPHREPKWKAAALELLHGRGAVNIYRRDDDRWALCIEQCVPGFTLLGAGLTHERAAKQMAVSTESIQRHVKKPHVARSVAAAKRARVDELASTLVSASQKAADRVAAIIDSDDDEVAIAAARVMLEYGHRFQRAEPDVDGTSPRHVADRRLRGASGADGGPPRCSSPASGGPFPS